MCKIQRVELLRLTEKLPNLEEVTLIAGADIKQADVIDFVRKSHKLLKLHLIVSEVDLARNFGNEIDDAFNVSTFWDESIGEGAIIVQRLSFIDDAHSMQTNRKSFDQFPIDIEGQIMFWHQNDINLDY